MMPHKVLAVFDLDGTLTSGVSLDREFGRFLFNGGMLGFNQLLIHAAYFLVKILSDPTAAVKRNKFYLRGMTVTKLNEAAKTFVARYNKSLLVKEAGSLIDSHRRSGQMTILLTGALYPLVRELTSQLDLKTDCFYGTELCEEHGKLTGRIQGTHYYGEAKAILVRELAIKVGADLSDSFCYANSITDLTMMELFGNPVAVNPDKKLAEIARERSWRIMYYSA